MKKLALAVVVLLTLLSGCASPLAWAPSPTSTRLPAVPRFAGVGNASVSTKSSTLIGAYEESTSSWSQMNEFGSKTGITPRLALYYTDWNSGFPTTFAQTARSHGAYVFDQLQPTGVTVASIAAGDSDAYLDTFARQLRAFGHPVILSFAHEMNGNWYSWGAGHASPSDFIAAWRHIVQLFHIDGVSNVTWVWSVNSTNFDRGSSSSLSKWWPGAAYVNWVGIDGYYYFKSDSYNSLFRNTIAELRTFTSAPVIISETAVGVTSNRETQISALFAGARSEHVIGVIWFDMPQSGSVYKQDWRLEDDPTALTAFRTAARKFLR